VVKDVSPCHSWVRVPKATCGIGVEGGYIWYLVEIGEVLYL